MKGLSLYGGWSLPCNRITEPSLKPWRGAESQKGL